MVNVTIEADQVLFLMVASLNEICFGQVANGAVEEEAPSGLDNQTGGQCQRENSECTEVY